MKRWQDDVIAFCFGDIAAMSYLYGNPLDLIHSLVINPGQMIADGTFKVLTAMIVGLVGGAFGLLGKDIYTKIIKPKIFKDGKE